MTRGPRRALVSVFIVVSFATQVLQNLGVGYMTPGVEAGSATAPLAIAFNRVRWGLETFGAYTGTNTYWRMFSPVHKYDWWWRVIATDSDGRQLELVAPSASASDPSSLHFGFRDAKMLMNLWTRIPMQAAYIDHRCHEQARTGHKPASIRLELHWRDILPQDRAASLGTHRATTTRSTVIASRSCS